MLGFSPDRVWAIKPKEKAIFGLEASFEVFLRAKLFFWSGVLGHGAGFDPKGTEVCSNFDKTSQFMFTLYTIAPPKEMKTLMDGIHSRRNSTTAVRTSVPAAAVSTHANQLATARTCRVDNAKNTFTSTAFAPPHC